MRYTSSRRIRHLLMSFFGLSVLIGVSSFHCSASADSDSSTLASKQLKIAVSAPSAADTQFNQLSEKYFDSLFRHDPDLATILGIHDYDKLAPDFSATARENRVLELRDFLKQFEELKASSLSAQAKIDHELIVCSIKSKLLTLENIRDWERNPDLYNTQSSSMIYDLMSRNFAPLSERLKCVIEREKKIPSILQSAKANLKNPPKIYTSVALDQLAGAIDFFSQSVPDTFKAVDDKPLLAEFEATNKTVVTALKEYQKFLQDDLLPKSNGNFSIGPDNFSKKLQYDEMADASIDQLLADGERELKRLQTEFVATAKEIDPNKSPAEIFKALSLDHPTPEKFIPSTQAMLNDLKQFLIDKKIVTIPPEGELKVEPTPSFLRALSFASMNPLGPFETKTKEAYYYVTVPEPDWTAERKEEHMRSYGKFSLMDTSVHEVFPGHYIQGLWVRQAPSKTTKILSSMSNVEGWAHYGEEMMVEQGLENGDKRLKLAMLHKALRRVCRYMVAIQMHAKNMSLDEGIAYFMNGSYEERTNAEREAKRGTIDATYLVYTLGKLQIMALREDYKKAKGKEFNIRYYHDRFLSTGCPPVKVIRDIMMNADK